MVERMEIYRTELELPEDWQRVILTEKCDCGAVIRHHNGGNYHRQVVITRMPDGVSIAVTFGSTMDWCLVDWEECVCGQKFTEFDRHEHYPLEEVMVVLREAAEWIGQGWAEVVMTRDGERIVRIYEIGADVQSAANECTTSSRTTS